MLQDGKNYLSLAKTVKVVMGPRGNQVLLANLENGEWIKITPELYRVVEQVSNLSVEDTVKWASTEYSVPPDSIGASIRFLLNRTMLEEVGEAAHYKEIADIGDHGQHRMIAYFVITHKCNLSEKCADEFLSCEDVKYAMEKLSLGGVKMVIFGGGEPLLREDIIDIIRYAADFIDFVVIETNGILLTPQTCSRLEGSVDRLEIKLNGSVPQVHDPISGKGTFNKVITGIKNAKKADIDVVIRPMVHRTNVGDIPNMIEIADSLGVEIAINPIAVTEKEICSPNQEAIDSEDMLKLMKALWIRSAEFEVNMDYPQHPLYKGILDNCRVNCGAGSSIICISKDGGLYPCHLLQMPMFRIGSIFEEETLDSILNESDIVTEINNRHVDNLPHCRECDVRYFCGGGCFARAYIEHESISAIDKRCPMWQDLFRRLLWNWQDDRALIENIEGVFGDVLGLSLFWRGT